jgi:DNA-binding beta-propeller fold protein YncE
MRRLTLLVLAMLLVNITPNALGQKLLKGIDIGGQPGIPTANPITNMIYVPTGGSNTLTVISGAIGQIVATIPIGQPPTAVTVNPTTNLVYVAAGTTIAVIDGASNTVTTTVPVTLAIGIAVNPATNLIYYISGGSQVSVLDGSTNQVVGTINTGLACCIQGIAVNATTNRIYVSERPQGGTNQLIAINGETDKFESFPLSGTLSVGTPVVDSKLNRVYVPDNTRGGLYVLNGGTGKIIDNVLAGYVGPVAINSTTHQIADFQTPSGVTQMGFFNPNSFAQVGTQIEFPQDPIYVSSGVNGRFYVCFAKTNSVAIVSGPAQGARSVK